MSIGSTLVVKCWWFDGTMPENVSFTEIFLAKAMDFIEASHLSSLMNLNGSCGHADVKLIWLSVFQYLVTYTA